jgi:hypothetical protein
MAHLHIVEYHAKAAEQNQEQDAKDDEPRENLVARVVLLVQLVVLVWAVALILARSSPDARAVLLVARVGFAAGINLSRAVDPVEAILAGAHMF